MSITIPGSITGSAITGLTSPTYTVASATGPDVNSKRGIISALGGTQTDVRVHTVSDPFDVTVWAPKVPKALPAIAANGVRPTPPMNSHSVVVRKGLIPSADLSAISSPMMLKWDTPAGAESYDTNNLAAQFSAMAGFCAAMVSSLLDNTKTGSV